MRKLIHSKFELDLSNFKISDTEENNWFSDSFFTKYSFPFEIDLTEDLNEAFDFISLFNAIDPQTYFELKYVHNNTIQDAIFEIEQLDQKLSCTLRFGFEQLPSFDKKLSELSLDKFDLPAGTTIYEHAESIISQTWPAVNYNFPQVHIDKIQTDSDEWAWFKKIINNRVAGVFLENEIDLPNQYTYNRNIMQPLPYMLHILQRGMADAGYTLSGNILTDERIKKATLYGDVDYYIENKMESYEVRVSRPDFITKEHVTLNYYYTTFKFTQIVLGIGEYRILGTAKCYFSTNGKPHLFTIKHNGAVIFSVTITALSPFTTDYDILITTISNSDIVEFELAGTENYDVDYFPIASSINPVGYYDGDINPFITIINENKVDLTKAVPDKLFGDVVKDIKNWFNYDLSIVGDLAVMNLIEDEINYNNAFPLEDYEVKYPVRKFSQGTSFLLKFTDIESKAYTFLPVFQTRDSIVNTGYVVNDKTTTIEINALPLPILTRDGVKTAHAFESNDSKVYLVPYDGLTNDNNYAKPSDEYLIPEVHLRYWKKWFDFRINSQSFNWVFKIWNEQIVNLKVKTKIFAYNNYHIIKNINKTEIEPDLFEVEIETEALK